MNNEQGITVYLTEKERQLILSMVKNIQFNIKGSAVIQLGQTVESLLRKIEDYE